MPALGAGYVGSNPAFLIVNIYRSKLTKLYIGPINNYTKKAYLKFNKA